MSGSFLEIVGSGAESSEDHLLAPPSEDLFPLADVFTAPPAAPLVSSPTKRVHAIDQQARSKRQKVPARSRTHPEDRTVSLIPGDSAVQATFAKESSEGPGVPTGFGEFVDTVLFESVGFMQISSDLCIVQGWDSRTSEASDSWFHAHFAVIGSSIKVACQCSIRTCFHARFLVDFFGTEFIPNSNLPSALETPVSFFYRRNIGNGSFKNIFSTSASSGGNPANRAIVVYEGLDTGTGIWTCSKDCNEVSHRNGTCAHIKMAAEELGLIIDGGPASSETGALLFTTPVWRVNEEIAISHLPILPPIWAVIPSDPPIYPCPPPARLHTQFPLFRLDDTSSCPCTGSERTSYYQPDLPLIVHEATLYTSVGSAPCKIELQPCLNCPASRKQFIGPDLREQGIFNFNNATLISHELLDEYTSAYTLSETPFDAWVEFLHWRYMSTGTQFMGRDLFRSCWFAFARLQQFGADFYCPECGQHPESVIWDGVTLAFHRCQLLPSIKPPTALSTVPHTRPTKYILGQQVLPFPALRKSLRSVAGGDESRKSAASLGPQETVQEVADHLREVSVELANLFADYYGAQAKDSPPPRPICHFFQQVAAEESVLQMITRPSQNTLKQFIADPREALEQNLRDSPHIYNLLRFDRTKQGGKFYSPSVLAAANWLLRRSLAVLAKLLKNSPPNAGWATDLDISDPPSDIRWESTGCFYSMPQIRTRPIYPSLAGDMQADHDGQRGGKCSKSPSISGPACGKYYATYGQKCLTGGIMVAWCTHSISYGFHCIPEGEGRNDVFSAMITRWPRAPKRVIYDFSCALGPYCLLREPDFFADTIFMIDNFHARDHTKCSPACFASTYAEVDPTVANINTSAAECGNSLIARIRKSVSYMGQRRAIIYTKIFLSIANRIKIQGMLNSSPPAL